VVRVPSATPPELEEGLRSAQAFSLAGPQGAPASFDVLHLKLGISCKVLIHMDL